MSEVVEIGSAPWGREDMLDGLEEFAELYAKRPIKNNTGGMKSPHMFPVWFALRKLKPAAIVESGVFLGQGTWLFEKACPEAKFYCIDINLKQIKYRSAQAEYFDRDFSTIDWSGLPKNDTVLFFDDHQNAYERLKTAKQLGFKHLIFEDNYSRLQGDCYSLKKAFMGAGFVHVSGGMARFDKNTGNGQYQDDGYIQPNDFDGNYLRQNIEVYYEFPPVFKTKLTRWNDLWDKPNYPTPEPLLNAVEKDYQQVFLDEAKDYTWICYVKLK